MALDEGQPPLPRRRPHRCGHRVVQRRESCERPLTGNRLGDPGRMLVDITQFGDEVGLVGGIQRGEGDGSHVHSVRQESRGAFAANAACSRCQWRAISSRVAIQTRSRAAT